MPSYTTDPELDQLAQRIIQTDRKGLKVLRIAYMFRPEAPCSDGKVTAGMCVRLDDRNYTLHQYDFVIEIANDIWIEATTQFKHALMDHELGHIGVRMDEDGQPAMDEKSGRIKTFSRKHDVEEFEDVLTRHGDYHSGLRSFLKAFADRKEAAKKPKKTNGESSNQEVNDDGDVSL